jgi:hypothetical protein
MADRMMAMAAGDENAPEERVKKAFFIVGCP